MPELFREMYYGPNVQNLVESYDCKVMRLSDNSGEGMMTRSELDAGQGSIPQAGPEVAEQGARHSEVVT